MDKRITAIVALAIVCAAFAGAVAADDASAEDTASYSLTYHVGDSTTKVRTSETAVFTVEDIKSLELSVASGKAFAGWYTQADGKGTAYAVGDKLTITGAGVTSADLYAYIVDIYTVQYTVAGVTYTQTFQGVSQITLPTIAGLNASIPAGKEFKGWFIDANANGVRDDTESLYAAGSTAELKSGLAYTADLQAITYTVTFAVDGEVISTVSGTADQSIAAPADPAKKGYIFLGWTLDGTAVATLKDVKFTANAAYTALFKPDYALTFDISGTEIAGGTVSAPIIPENPTKEGYIFAGWSVDGVAVGDLTAYLATVAAPTKLSAIFEPVVYSVTFVSDGEVVLPVQTVRHGELVTEPKTIPTKQGYDFAGWVLESADAEGVTVQTAYDFASPVTGDLTITAAFTATPEPAKTGLSDPVVLSAVIIAVLILGFVLAVLYLKKDTIKAKLADRLAAKEGDKKA